MNITLSVSVLKNAVARLDRIAQKTATLPVLQCIFFEAKKKSVLLRSTNLDIGAEIVFSADIENEGKVAVPARVLHGILQSMSGNTVTLTENHGNLEVRTKQSKSLVKCFPADDFPKLPTIPEYELLSIDLEKIKNGIRSVVGSVAVTDIKPELASVYIHSKNSVLVFAATDSVRLAEQQIPIKQRISLGEHGILIPAKNAQELLKFIEPLEGLGDIRFSKHQLSCATETNMFTTRLIDAAFPDYEQIIPKNHTTEIVVSKQDLLDALRLGTVFSNTYSQITLTFDPKKKEGTVETKNSDVGEGVATIPATITGEPLEISCNYRYLTEVIPNIPSDHLFIGGNGPEKPITIRSSNSTAFTYLVMPMNR